MRRTTCSSSSRRSKVDSGKTLDDQFTSLPSATPPGDGDADFENPCAEAGDCVLSFPCVENEDVFVEFNITVMRDAEQGFFDIAVNFEDIFCSAKFDSCVGEDVPDTFVPPRFVRDVSIDRAEKADFLGYRFAHAENDTKFYVVGARVSGAEGNYRYDSKGDTKAWMAVEIGKFGSNANSKDMSFVGLRADDKSTPETSYVIAGVGPINAAKATLATKPNRLLFGEDGERDHTAVAALACTAGPDAKGTELVFSTPVVSCQTADGDKVSFKLDGLDTLEEGDAGNQEISVLIGPEPGTKYTLRYGVYFDTEDLSCGQEVIPASTEHVTNDNGDYLYVAEGDTTEFYARYVNGAWRLYYINAVDDEEEASNQDGRHRTPRRRTSGTASTAVIVDVPGSTEPISCNKAFYNLAFNIGDLAEQGLIGCAFDWGATAIEAGSDIFTAAGYLADENGVYPGIGYSGILLTGRPDENDVVPSLCSENPLNGEWSSVETGYVKGKGYGNGDDQGNGPKVDYHTKSTELPKRYIAN